MISLCLSKPRKKVSKDGNMPDLLTQIAGQPPSGWPAIAILSMLPFSENRGAIIYGIASGFNPLLVFFVASLFNVLVMIPLLMLLNTRWIKNLVDKILGNWVQKKIARNRERLEVYEELALLLFVAVPFVGTGGYTGSLISAFLQMNPRKSFFVISVGIFLAGIITLFATLGTRSVIVALQ